MGRAPDYLPCTAIGMEHQNDKILKRLGLWHTGCSWYFQILQKLGLSHTSLSLRCSWLSSQLACNRLTLCVHRPTSSTAAFSPQYFQQSISSYFSLPTQLVTVCLFLQAKDQMICEFTFYCPTLSHRLSYVSDVDQNRADYDGLCVQRHTFFHLLLCLFDHSGFITCMSLRMSLSPHTRVTSS